MDAFWNHEQFKFILKFSEVNDQLEDYIICTDQRVTPTSIVVGVDFDFKSSQSSTSTLFTMQPSDNAITVMDEEGQLNPLNTNSDYYGYMCQGLKILAYVADYVDDEDDYDWQSYGTWYVSHWTGGMENGGRVAVTIGCDDLLSEIAAFDLSNTEYSGATAANALETCMTAVGLTSADYSVDSNLDLTFSFTQLNATVGMTISDILTLSRGYCTIGHDDKIKFMSLSTAASTANSYEMGPELGALSQNMASGVNYSKVIVRYPSGTNTQLFAALRDQYATVNNGTTVVKFTMPSGIRSIEALRTVLKGCADGDSLTDVSYVLSGTTIEITVTAVVAEPRNCLFDIYATAPSSETYNETTVSLDGISSNSSYAYVYDARYTTDVSEAEAIAESLAAVVKSMRAMVSCGTSMLSPAVTVGDTIEIVGVSDEYDGTYALVSFSIEMQDASYNTRIKLLKYEEE